MHRLRPRNRRRNKQRKIIIISACSPLLFMTVGYAAMSTNLEINAKGNIIKKATAGNDLVEMVGIVNTGDGLYKDSYEENVYTYRGSNPNNYVTFNNELWRIISVNTNDNTIKIIRNVILENRLYDTANGRYQGSSGYCNNNEYGCNIWGSSSTLYDENLSPITELAREVSETKYTLPNKEADLNDYLNGEYYNRLNTMAKSMIKEDAVYKVGVLYCNNTSINQDIEQVNAVKWKGKIALIDATEYIKASTDSSCTNIDAAYTTANCKNDNWIFNNDTWWTISPYSYSYSRDIGAINSNGLIDAYLVRYAHGVRPVVTLKPDVKITSGDGSENVPYILEI